MLPYPFPLRQHPQYEALAAFLRLTGEAVGHYLPLAAFKYCPGAIKGAQPTDKAFLSSGTTGALRSRSAFSAAGLAAYREAATSHFRAVLQAVSRQEKEIRLISLIPTASAGSSQAEESWPDSSLAYMVAAFGEAWPLTYTTPEGLAAAVRAQQGQPLVVLGTALHFLAVIEGGHAVPLPQNTWLMETGGTKGQFRQLSRAGFYELLEQHFVLPQRRIISEYGSCELAAQAYDYCEFGADTPLAARSFRFANDVTVWVGSLTKGKNESDSFDQVAAHSKGTGRLMLFDPHRLDYPYLIETEDRIELTSDGSFKLLGRVQTAELKGCSLLAEQPPAAGTNASKGTKPPQPQGNALPLPGLGDRIRQLRQLWQRLLADGAFEEALQADLALITAGLVAKDQVKTLALYLKSDLATSFLAPSADYLGAIAQNLGRSCLEADLACGREGERWLMVLPSSHPVAGLYPLTLAAAMGLWGEVRASSRRQFRALSLFISELQKFSFVRMKVVEGDAAYRASLDRAGGLLAFGQDATIQLFRQSFTGTIRGFGDALAGTVVAGPPSPQAVDQVVKDIVSLGGQGCLSSRFLVVASAAQSDCRQSHNSQNDCRQWQAALTAALQPFRPRQPLSRSEDYQRAIQGYSLLQGYEAPALGPWQLLVMEREPAGDLAAYLPPLGHNIPLLWLRAQGLDRLVTLPRLKKLSVSEDLLEDRGWAAPLAGVELCPLGQLNSHSFTGRHLGEPLF